MGLLHEIWLSDGHPTKKIIALRFVIICLPIVIVTLWLASRTGDIQNVKMASIVLLGFLIFVGLIGVYVYKHGPVKRKQMPSWAPAIVVIVGIAQLILATILYLIGGRYVQLILTGIFAVMIGLYLEYMHRKL